MISIQSISSSQLIEILFYTLMKTIKSKDIDYVDSKPYIKLMLSDLKLFTEFIIKISVTKDVHAISCFHYHQIHIQNNVLLTHSCQFFFFSFVDSQLNFTLYILYKNTILYPSTLSILISEFTE